MAVLPVALVLCALLVSCGSGHVRASERRVAHTPARSTADRVRRVRFFSRALGQERAYEVYLPPRYAAQAARGVRFPVLYLLHAPPGRPDGFFTAGRLQAQADALIASGAVKPFLAVLPYGQDPPYHNDTEWANAAAGRYEDFVLDTVRAADVRWSTIPRRGARAIGGISEGAYGAVNVGLHHLSAFAAVESWSGYFTQDATGPFAGASTTELEANSPAAYVGRERRALGRLPLRAFLYQGARDDVSAASMREFAGALRHSGAAVRTAIFPGPHSWRLWAPRLPLMLRFADRSFRAAAAATRG